MALATPISASISAPIDIQSGRIALQKAENAFAFGDFDRARTLLLPLTQEEKNQEPTLRIQAHKLLGIIDFLLDDKQAMHAHFEALLLLDPDHRLDPFTVAPSIIAAFDRLRAQLEPRLLAIRQLQQHNASIAKPGDPMRTVVHRISERSRFLTFLPFGVGQFAQGHTALGVVFAATQAVLLGINVGAYLGALSIGPYPQDKASTIQALTIAQYSALALFGLSWSLGVYHAQLHFEPNVATSPMIHDGQVPKATPGMELSLHF